MKVVVVLSSSSELVSRPISGFCFGLAEKERLTYYLVTFQTVCEPQKRSDGTERRLMMMEHGESCAKDCLTTAPSTGSA